MEEHPDSLLSLLSESQVEMVEVTEWEDCVLLPFQTKPGLPQDVTVGWRRSDSKHMNVHVFQLSEEQDQVYRGRTDMSEDSLTTGDLSLKLKQPHTADCGVYTCTVHREGKVLKQKVVVLSVRGQSYSDIDESDVSLKHSP